MSSHRDVSLHPEEKYTLGSFGPKGATMAFGVGALFLVISLAMGAFIEWRRFLFTYVVSFGFWLTLALGGLFFTIIQHLVSAKWSVTLRRIAELLTTLFVPLAALSLVILIPVLLRSESIYPWLHPDKLLPDADKHMVHAKEGYLNGPFFLIRFGFYFLIWLGVSRFFLKKSVEQDESGDPAITTLLKARSGPALMLFGLTTSFAGFDLLMSMHPAWFSTMFGVYFFSGAAVLVFSALAIIPMLLQRMGLLTHSITVEHYHDVGKFLFAFVFFWGYIAFSQFMLIWYADIPEETIWYALRMETNWSWLSIVLLFGHFVIPFVLLMSRNTKRRLPALAFFALWMAVMHYVDLFWIVMPSYNPMGMVFHPLDITVFLGVGGICIGWFLKAASGVNLLPIKDPALGASLGFENY